MLALALAAALAASAPAHHPMPQPTAGAAAAALKQGFAAYRAGDYAAATNALRAALEKKPLNEEWTRFLLAESEFYGGAIGPARADYDRVARGHLARLAKIAAFRAADCAWSGGDHPAAAKLYRRLLGSATPAIADRALVRYRVADEEAARDPAAARREFLAIAREFPAHPLADEAARRAGPAPATAGAAAGPSELSPSDRLRRAESLDKDRHWDEALAELGKLPAALPDDLAAERDYQIGMTKFHMRRDYAAAGELLLATVPHLSGDKAASAAFHGARALSRADRDDEAIAGYRRVIEKFPRSRFAAEAQYLSGWLEYNRGHFRASLPALQATLDHFGSSAFADDAAWCLAFAHFLLGDAAEAAAGLERYARLPATGMTDAERNDRVAYWRARMPDKLGKRDEAMDGYRALAQRSPLGFYGLLARARLKETGHEQSLVLPVKKTDAGGPKPPRLPVVARAEELIAAGLDVEAGELLEESEKQLLRPGGTRAEVALLALLADANDFHHAYRFAESHDAGALGADPHADAGVRAFWQAAYPRAYAPLVEEYGPPAGNPDLYLYAIMRKESGFDPHDVSYADARGLLQMIPPTSARVADAAGEPFFSDQLYEPIVNIRLGALYIGSLFKKFGGEIPLAAGAYNAGPRAMARWCNQHAAHPTDEFVELIAFTQTREYVKRVTSLFASYRFLYGPAPFEIPLSLKTAVAPGGPDY